VTGKAGKQQSNRAGHKGRKPCPPKWPQISPQGGAKVLVTKDSGTLPTPGARTNPHPDGTDAPQKEEGGAHRTQSQPRGSEMGG